MSEINNVSVLICGQEYTLSGDMPREYIMKLADKVDEKMREVSADAGQPLSKTAVLAAMLIADELFKSQSGFEDIIEENSKLKSQYTEHSTLLDDARESFDTYKTETERMIGTLKEKIVSLEERLANSKTGTPEAQRKIEELEKHCKDLESSFFDLQMENLRLSSRLSEYQNKDF